MDQYIEPATGLMLLLIFTCLAGFGLQSIYRLYFHPLSGFPGPRLAAVSGWYQFYYDIIAGGQYIFHLLDLSRTHNWNIVRVATNHLQINDSELFHKVFKPGTEFQRDPEFYGNIGLPNALSSLTDFKQHGARRKKFNSAFTSSAVSGGLPTLVRNLDEIGEVLSESLLHGNPVDIQKAFCYMAHNMISDRIFGSSLRILEDKDVLDDFVTALDFFQTHSLLFLHFRWLGRIVDVTPDCVMKYILPGYVRLRQYCSSKIQDVLETRRQKPEQPTQHKTLCSIILDSMESNEQMSPKNIKYLIDESVLFMFAGTDTTAHTLSIAVYLLLTHPDPLQKLKSELHDAQPAIRSHDWAKIRKLPYLTAVIEEALRIACPAPGLVPRVVPPQGCSVGPTFIPGGTIISLALLSISTNETIFGDPNSFRPERWLDPENPGILQWRVQFSAGPYACIGMKLASMEMAMSLAFIFSRFELALHDTNAETVKLSDYVLAKTKSHVQVKVLKDNWR